MIFERQAKSEIQVRELSLLTQKILRRYVREEQRKDCCVYLQSAAITGGRSGRSDTFQRMHLLVPGQQGNEGKEERAV